MKKRKILKSVLFTFLALFLVGISFLGYTYYNYFGKFEVDTEKYQHYVGYINQDKALLNSKYKLCDESRVYKVHHGAPKDAFKGSKKRFKDYILSNYKNESYKDSGYLNFRFLVNCEGNVGWFEIIEMNLELEETKLNKKMVDQLLTLTSDSKNWAIYNYKNQPKNYYMYISYRIENGEITQILP